MTRESGTVIYKSASFDPWKVDSRYLGYQGDEIIMYCVDAKSWTILEIVIEPHDVPMKTLDMLDQCRHHFPNQVRVRADLEPLL